MKDKNSKENTVAQKYTFQYNPEKSSLATYLQQNTLVRKGLNSIQTDTISQ